MFLFARIRKKFETTALFGKKKWKEVHFSIPRHPLSEGLGMEVRNGRITFIFNSIIILKIFLVLIILFTFGEISNTFGVSHSRHWVAPTRSLSGLPLPHREIFQVQR